MKIHSVECPACKKYFNSEFGVCPFCGNVYTEEVQQPTKPRPEGRKKNPAVWIVPLCAAVLLIVAVSAILVVWFFAKPTDSDGNSGGNISVTDSAGDVNDSNGASDDNDGNDVSDVDNSNAASDVNDRSDVSDVNANNDVVEDPIVSVQKYDNMMNIGVCCDLKDAPEEIRDHLTDYQKSVCWDVQEITCCKTTAEMKKHVDRYVDSALQWEFDEKMLLEYEGKMYIVLQAKGYTTHNYTDYEKINDGDGRVIVKTDSYHSGNYPGEYAEFIMEKTAENYRVLDVETKW